MKNKMLLTLICFFLLPLCVFAGGNNDDTKPCPSGYTLTGDNCIKVEKAYQREGTYYCAPGHGTLSEDGRNCVISTPANNSTEEPTNPEDNVYLCVDGKSYADGTCWVYYKAAYVRQSAYFCITEDGVIQKNIGTGCYKKIDYSEYLKSIGKDKTAPVTTTKSSSVERVSCKTLFGDPTNSNEIAHWLQWSMRLIKYAGIIALFAMSTADFVKALISNDQDSLKKAGTTTLKRFIYCVLLFFLPIIVDTLMTLIGAYGTCNIG